MDNSTLNIIVKLQDEASSKLEALSTKMQTIGDKVGTVAQNVGTKMSAMGASMITMGKSMQSAGQNMSVGLTLPIVALGTAVVDASMKFQASMELISTQAGASQTEVDKMTKSVLELAKSGETGQGPQSLAQGLFHLESLGLRGADAMNALKIAADAADTGMANMEDVSNALGSAMVTGMKGTENADEAMGTLNATIGAGNMKMQELASALGTGILPAAGTFGLSLTDVGAALATLTDNGMQADQAATRLRMTFSLMAAPTDTATKALETLGLKGDTLAKDMRTGGIVKAIDDLKTHLEASGQTATEQAATLARAFGGGRTSAAIDTLVSESDRVATKFQQITANANDFNKAVSNTHATNQFKLHAALASMQVTLIDIGGTVMPMVSKALKTLSGYMEEFTAWWDKLNPNTQAWIVKGLALLAVLGPILVIFGSLFTAIGSILSVGGALITFLFGSATATGALSTAFSFLAANPIVAVIAAFAGLIIILDKIMGKMSDLKGMSADAAKMSQQSETINQKLSSQISNTSDPTQKAKMQSALQASQAAQQTQSNIANAGFWKNLSVGLGLSHYETGGTVQGLQGRAVPIIAHGGETIIPANRKGKNGGDVIMNFHFNSAVAGDEGIKQIIKQTVDSINRQTSLKTMAGA